MADPVVRTLRSSLAKLSKEKERLDRQITALQSALDAMGARSRMNGMPRRRRMSAASRKAIGARMKAYWASRRKAAAKPEATTKKAAPGKVKSIRK